MHFLSDEFLLEAYINAVRQKLDRQFIHLLFDEIRTRGLAVPVTIAS
jgi:hypothetical protein